MAALLWRVLLLVVAGAAGSVCGGCGLPPANVPGLDKEAPLAAASASAAEGAGYGTGSGESAEVHSEGRPGKKRGRPVSAGGPPASAAAAAPFGQSDGGSGSKMGTPGDDHSGSSPPQQLGASAADFFGGWIGFDVPPRMKQGRHIQVTVSLGRERQQVLGTFPAGDPNVQVEAQRLSRVVSVSLQGEYDGDFSVTPSTNERQAVLDDGPTSWLFDVLPLKAGDKRLVLRVDAMLILPGHPGEVPYTERTRRPITVTVDPVYVAKGFVTNHWPWFASTVVVPVFGWATAKWRSRRRPRQIGFR